MTLHLPKVVPHRKVAALLARLGCPYLQHPDKAISALASAAAKQLDQAAADFKSGALTHAQALDRVRQIEAQAPDANKASMTLVGLRSRGYSEGPAWGAAEGWLPREGEEVSVLKMGGATGQVGHW